MLMARPWCPPVRILVFALAVGGCDASSPHAPNPAAAAPAFLIVSDPARGSSAASVGAAPSLSLHGNGTVTYVSAEPGSVQGAVGVEVENLRLQQPVPATLESGGFDPVTVPAVEGDSIEVRFKLAGGGVHSVRAAVPARRRPRVVRTHPARGRRDVAINSIVATVFSEPINPTTLRDSTVRLLRDGIAVRGTLRLAAGPVPGVEFVPAEALLPGTVYQFVLDGRILDLAGDPLEVPEPVEFVTFGEGGTGALTVITSTRGTDRPDGYEIMVDGRVAEQIGVSDTVVITGLGAGEHHVLLSAMSDYCYATGGLYRQVRLTQTQDAAVAFDVTCTDFPQLELRVATTGVQLDEDGYQVVVNRQWAGDVPPDGTLQLRAVRYGVNVVTLNGVRGNCRDPQTLRRIVDLSGGEAATVTFTLVCTPDYIPAGRIAFASYIAEASSAIVVADADGSNRVQVTDGSARDRLPAWSPDGSRLAFVRGDEWGDSKVYIANADGTGLRERELPFGPGSIHSLAWVSEGQELAFATEGRFTYVVPAEGHIDEYGDPAMRELTMTGFSSGTYAWSPVDSRIAYVWGRSVRIADEGGTYMLEILDDLAGVATWATPAWSPDGGRIAVFACRDPIEGECTNLSLEIRPVIGRGSTVIPLAGWMHRPVWSPDGSTFAYSQCSGCPGITYLRTDGIGTSVTISDGFDPAWRP